MYTFTKEERLCSQKLLDELYHKGSSFLLYPFSVIWLLQEPVAKPVQVVLQVPKRRFKHAVDRNYIRRRMREIYRLHKSELLYPFLKSDQTLLLGISYIGKELPEYAFMDSKLKEVFKKLVKEIALKQEGEPSWCVSLRTFSCFSSSYTNICYRPY